MIVPCWNSRNEYLGPDCLGLNYFGRMWELYILVLYPAVGNFGLDYFWLDYFGLDCFGLDHCLLDYFGLDYWMHSCKWELYLRCCNLNCVVLGYIIVGWIILGWIIVGWITSGWIIGCSAAGENYISGVVTLLEAGC